MEFSESVAKWDDDDLKPIESPEFTVLPSLDDKLSANQFCAYNICWKIIHGAVFADVRFLEVGKSCHSRWFILGCRLLRKYVLQKKCKQKFQDLQKKCKQKKRWNFKIVLEYCIQVYFPF